MLLAELREAAALLRQAPSLRIGAARRLQGVTSRRRTAAEALFSACNDVRLRIRRQYRGPGHAALRHAVGFGYNASPGKPQMVLSFADLVLAAGAAHAAALSAVRVGPPTLQRIGRLREQLVSCEAERPARRASQRQVEEDLTTLAGRVEDLCAELAVHGGAELPALDLSPQPRGRGQPVLAPLEGAPTKAAGTGSDRRGCGPAPAPSARHLSTTGAP